MTSKLKMRRTTEETAELLRSIHVDRTAQGFINGRRTQPTEDFYKWVFGHVFASVDAADEWRLGYLEFYPRSAKTHPDNHQ